MEYSSPLAAMRPPPCPAWGNRRDLTMPSRPYHGCQTYGPSSFDFKTMSMQNASLQTQQKSGRHDYFTFRPARGSSPTSSLTADLDANFHIDKSPQAPTPRRSLFTANLFQPRDETERCITTPFDIEEVTTPPIISSSSPGFDGMDISPLPHKAPYFQVTLPSPSLLDTLEDVDLITPDLLSPLEIPTPLQALAVQPPSFLPFPERRRPVTRPGLSRSKGFSTSCIPQPQRSTSPETQLRPFRFGNVVLSNPSCSSTPSLLDNFTESPVDDIQTVNAGGMLPSLRRTSISNGARALGSPSAGNVRKPSAGRPALVRPQKRVMRRSLSMFQHPDEIMREEQEAFVPQHPVISAMDVDQDHVPKLPHFNADEEPDSLPRITRQTMLDVLNSRYSTQYDQVMVIDCRFEYEYEGGHIQDAVNFNDKQQLAQKLFDGRPPSPSTLLILHCEYSVHRAPLTAKFIRSHDRNVNAHCYPQLTFPEMYILDGGYSKFFEEYRLKCYPQNYVEMNDQRHEQACERGMAKVKGRQKLFRHQTFTFGQHGPDDMEDSPTGQGRTGLGSRTRSAFGMVRISHMVSGSLSNTVWHPTDAISSDHNVFFRP